MQLEQEHTCFLCQKDEEVKLHDISGSNDMYRIFCPRCGQYKISYECYRFTDERSFKNRYLLSGLVRELNENKEEPQFLTTNIEKLRDSYPVPKPNDIEGKATKFLERIKARTEHFGQRIQISYENDYPLAYAKNSDELRAILKFLDERKLISLEVAAMASIVSLSADGWVLVGNMEPKNKKSQQGFVAAWFHESMDESINAIQEAITEVGFTPICIRDEHFSEKIMDKALGEIRKSRFLVIDLTGVRPSVFFEAGFAFGLDIDVIYVYKEKEDGTGLPPEFYVRHYQCYKYKDTTELKDIVKNAISARIKKV